MRSFQLVFHVLALLCAFVSVISGKSLDDEKGVAVKGSKDSSVLSMSLLFAYQHSTEEGSSFPSSIASDSLEYSGQTIMNLLKLDDKTTFEQLRSAVMRKTPGRDLINKLLDHSKFDKRLSEYETYLEEIGENDGNWVIHHTVNRTKLLNALMPFYILLGTFAFALYVCRDKFNNYCQFKLTPVCKLLCSFLAFRLFYDLGFLIYLLAFHFFGRLGKEGFIYYVFLFADQIISLIVFHMCVTIFCLGYLTVSSDKKLLYSKNAVVSTILYFVCVTCVKVHTRIKEAVQHSEEESLTNYAFDWKDHHVEVSYFAMVVTILMRVAIWKIVITSAIRTYRDHQKNQKFLRSFLLVVGCYLLAGYIKFPVFYSLQEFLSYFKTEMIGEAYANWDDQCLSVPEIFQIICCCSLIYMWCDSSSEKKETFGA